MVESQKKSKILQFLSGIFFIIILAGGLFFTLIQPVNFSPVKEVKLISGEWMSVYQKRYEEKLSLRSFAQQAWGFIRYSCFHEGWPGVLVGKEGWLFTSEEFVFNPAAARQTEINLTYIQAVQQQLAARQISLVIALVPDKSRTYGECLGRYQYPAYAQARYQSFRQQLLSLGILAPDLETAIQAVKAHEQVWLRADTHWSAAGARVAAITIATEVKPLLARHREIPRKEFALKISVSEPYDGDLMRFIPLGPFRKVCGLKPELTTTQDAVPVVAGTSRAGSGLFDNPQLPVVLAGTSYSAGKKWGFDAALQYYLEADVLNVAKEGLGPFLPMQSYLNSTTFKELPPVLIIWEIPERYLPVAFPNLQLP